MTAALAAVLGLVLVLAPVYAAVPDEPLWSSWLLAGALGAAAWAAWRGRGTVWARPARAEWAFLALLGLAFLSILWRLVSEGGTAFLGPMLRGWATLAGDFALFALARRVAGDGHWRWGLALAALAGAVWAADSGVQEYVAHVKAGQAGWRIFATSTPDYLAGYFVLTLPVTLALLLQTPSARGLTPLGRGLAAFALGVALLLQIAALFWTGSRFALVSLAVSLLAFGLALGRASRAGLVLHRASRGLLLVAGAGLVLGAALFARPVWKRLHTVNDNSAAFRVWTWKGSLRMAEANPALGTGVGTWPDAYPRYALTGFTRVAHNSYLQMADECGVPALLALLAALGLTGAALARGLGARPSDADPGPDGRLLLCGLAAACAGGVTQNLIDSDWYVFFLGATFWTLAGLAAGAAAPPPPEGGAGRPAGPVVLAVAGAAGAFSLFCAAQGVAALSVPDYQTARAWDPLSARYPSDEGYKVLARRGDLSGAEAALRESVAREPNAVNWKRLGDVLHAQDRTQDALAAYRAGLATDPHSLALLLLLAKLSPPPAGLTYYEKIADLEQTPVGTVRALGESVETRFGEADAALGDADARADPARALTYYARAASVIERFVDAGGSTNPQQQALSGFRPDPEKDAAMRDLYAHVMDARIALGPASDRAALRKRQADYRQKLDIALARSTEAAKSGILAGN